MRLRLLVAAFALVALAALALGHRPARTPQVTRPGRIAPPPRAEEAGPSAVAVDPADIRDVFHFAEARVPSAHGAPARAREGREDAAPPPAGPRLVGLVTRAGRLVAALAVDGEVVLAGPGETAAGVTVLAVGDEGVRVRRADGSEETLVLP
jgi:hypothetical protein